MIGNPCLVILERRLAGWLAQMVGSLLVGASTTRCFAALANHTGISLKLTYCTPTDHHTHSTRGYPDGFDSP